MRSPATEFRPPKQSNVYRSGITAHVKWFAPEKGFGFVTLDDGSGEAFLHASALRAGPYDDPVAGQEMVCDIGPGQKGPQVALIHSVAPPPVDAGRRTRASAQLPRPSMPRRTTASVGNAPRPSAPREIEGTVKFFSPEKGFGFVTPDRGSKDIFVHQNALRRSGLDALQPRVRVRVRVQETEKGLEAEHVAFL